MFENGSRWVHVCLCSHGRMEAHVHIHVPGYKSTVVGWRLMCRMFDQLQNLDSSFTHRLQVEPLGAILGDFPTWKNNTKALQWWKLECLDHPQRQEILTWNLFIQNGKRDDCGYLSQTLSASGLYSPDPIGAPQSSPIVTCRVRPSPFGSSVQAPGALYCAESIANLCMSRLGSKVWYTGWFF